MARLLVLLFLYYWRASPLTITPQPGIVTLSSLATPALVLDLDRYARNANANSEPTLSFLRTRYVSRGWDRDDIEGSFFVHAQIASARDDRHHLPTVDFCLDGTSADALELYLALGLNNHYVGGYYWARACVGIGPAMEAPGVTFDAGSGQLGWDASSQSNDGKRSEWVEFLRRGDQVQLCLRLEEKEQSAAEALSEVGRAMEGGGGRREGVRVAVVSAKGVPKGAEVS